MRYVWMLLLLTATVNAQPTARKSESTVMKGYTGQKDSLIHARYLTVQVGDSTKNKFEPAVKMSLWGGECQFDWNLRNAKTPLPSPKPTFDTVGAKARVSLGQGDVEYRMYEIDRGLEFEIRLASKPSDSVFAFPITDKSLRFYYQDTLTDAEKANGHIRPDSVVGSYAAYHGRNQGNKVVVGEMTERYLYGTGKAFHIYRPKAWDSVGDTVWCTIDIDTEVDSMFIAMPTSFYNSATYPVVIDPTIGYTTAGGSSANRNNDISGLYVNSLGSFASLDSVTAYYVGDMGGAVYEDSAQAHRPTFLVDSCDSAHENGSAAWFGVGVTFTDTLMPMEGYYLCMMDGGGTVPSLYYDAGSTDTAFWHTSTSWPPPAHTSFTATQTFIYSIYATYTVISSGVLDDRNAFVLGRGSGETCEDSYLSKLATSTNYSSATTLPSAYDDGSATDRFRGVFKWNTLKDSLQAINDRSDSVVACTLWVRDEIFTTLTTDWDVHGIIRYWEIAEVTWDSAETDPGGVAWATGGANNTTSDISSAGYDSKTGRDTLTSPYERTGYYAFDVTGLVQTWRTDTSLAQGFIFDADATGAFQQINLYSDEATGITNGRPWVMVYWDDQVVAGAPVSRRRIMLIGENHEDPDDMSIVRRHLAFVLDGGLHGHR